MSETGHTPEPDSLSCEERDEAWLARRWAIAATRDEPSSGAFLAEDLEIIADELDRRKAVNAEMLAALLNVRKLISEAAMTGFNCQDGDWAERLFASQQVTSAAVKKATGAQA